jgi:hypothetical protein
MVFSLIVPYTQNQFNDEIKIIVELVFFKLYNDYMC